MSDKLAEIVDEINKRASGYEIGDFHTWRKTQNPNLIGKKFLMKRKGKRWAAHLGGRLELQYNVGIREKENEFRYGVAFSFKQSQTYPFQELRKHLDPKVQKFNQYVSSHPDLLKEMSCFRYDEAKKRRDFPLKNSIPNDLVKEGVFIFFGKTRRISKVVDYDEILKTFDRLFPLYKHCEPRVPLVGGERNKREGFSFEPGYREKTPETERKTESKATRIKETHKRLKKNLYDRKTKEHGKENVGTERPSGNGQFIDLVIKKDSKYWFYEIKTQKDDRLCIREAIGQLLEYSYWPGCEVAERLVVVGEPELTKQGKEYLKTLREKLKLPVFYEQIIL